MRIFLTLSIVLISQFGFSQNVPSYIPTNGLIGWYPFNGNTNDESGNGNDGVNNGGVLDSDKDGNPSSSYYFDGNSGIDIPNSSLQGDFTISFWMNPSVGDYIYYPVELRSDSVPDFPGIGISGNNPPCNLDTSIVYLFDGESGCYNVLNSNLQYNNSQFHFVVVSRMDTSYRITIDNSSVYDDTTLNIFSINSVVLGIRENGYGFTGILDDIGIWERYLTDEEISGMFNEIPLNTENVKNLPLFKVYPNPTSDFLQIDCGDISTINGYSIKIINSLGQSVFDEPVSQSPFNIDMNGWNGNGLYFLHLIDGSGNITDIRKIVLE